MKSLRRYTIVALAVLSIELLIIFLYKTSNTKPVNLPKTFSEIVKESIPNQKNPPFLQKKNTITNSSDSLPSIEQAFISAKLTNVSDLDSTIVIELKYAAEDNFLHKNLYGNLKTCYLHTTVAKKLVNAQKQLKEEFPFYSLIVFDAARPLSIQKIMWDEMKVPENQKDNYVSNPAIGSLHNYGCAVDVSIINDNGMLLDMGTPYDFFGTLAYPVAEQRMLNEGKLSSIQYENRKLLRRIMINAGFTPITSEWWHFNGSSLKIAKEKFMFIN